MKRFSEQYPNDYVDETGNTRIDGANVSLNNSLDVTDSEIVSKAPFRVDGTFVSNSNFYLRNAAIDDLNTVPAGQVAIGFERNAPYMYSPDLGSISYFSVFNLRPVAADTSANVNDEIILIAGTESDPIVVTIPESAQVPATITYGGGIGNYNGVFDFGNTEVVIHNLDTGEERFRGTELGFRTGRRVTFRYFVVSINPLVAEWHGGYSIA